MKLLQKEKKKKSFYDSIKNSRFYNFYNNLSNEKQTRKNLLIIDKPFFLQSVI